MIEQRIVEIIGASFGLGSEEEEAFLSPKDLRTRGLIARLTALRPGLVDAGDFFGPEKKSGQSEPKLKNLSEALIFGEKLFPVVLQSYQSNHFPVVVGGDHSVSMFSIAAGAKFLRDNCKQSSSDKSGSKAELGVLWVDAHADINTPETSPSGDLHGMPLAVLLGLGDSRLVNAIGAGRTALKPENIVYVGLRDVDPGERELIKEKRITAFTMQDIDYLGMGEVLRRAFQQLNANTDGFVVSFDMDVCDPTLVPGVGTPVRGGLTFREAHLVMEMAAQQEKLQSIELVEYNPKLDLNGVSAEVCINLLESALGKTIL